MKSRQVDHDTVWNCGNALTPPMRISELLDIPRCDISVGTEVIELAYFGGPLDTFNSTSGQWREVVTGQFIPSPAHRTEDFNRQMIARKQMARRLGWKHRR